MGNRKSILIVDDDSHVLNQIEELFFGDNDLAELELLTALNGKKAVEIIAHNKIDLCITDINMPERDGIFFVKDLWRIAPKTKVILISGEKSEEDLRMEVNFEEFNIHTFFSKPLDFKALKATLKKLIFEDS